MDEPKAPPVSDPAEAARPVEPFVLKRGEHPISRKDIDPDVFKIIYRLHQQGFTAYLVGGAVRDLLLGKPPKDFDVVTDARPGQIKKRFRNAFLIGRRFRLAHVHFADGKIIEVATFRRDPEQAPAVAATPETQDSPSGPPVAPPSEHLAIYGTPAEDAFRRDTTINALFLDVLTSEVIDFVGGLEDMAGRKVRIIGDPGERFAEDPVRIWRVVRQAARLGFDIEQDTERSIPSHRHLVAACPGSRLFEELNKDLSFESRPVFEALNRHGLLPYILGAIGEDYSSRPELFDRVSFFLEIKDRAAASGLAFSQEEIYSLLFWPWVESRLDAAQGDIQAILKEAYAGVRTQAQIPKALIAGIVQTQAILAAMTRALQTSHMRWSLKGRPHYPQASRLIFFIARSRTPQAHESFATLYQETFPGSPTPRHRKRRRKTGRGGPELLPPAGPKTD